jgi:hypothetical protein
MFLFPKFRAMPCINLLTSSFLPLLMCFASSCLQFLSSYSQLYRFSYLAESEVEKKHGLLYPETVRALEPVAREVTMTSEGRLLQGVAREKMRL